MILASLHSYYQRLTETDDRDVAPEGFARQGVSFAFQLSEDGELLDVHDLRETAPKGGKLVPFRMLLPSLGEMKGSGIKADFLWGNPVYVLGRGDKGRPERVAKCQATFRRLHETLLADLGLPEGRALLGFLRDPPKDHPKVEKWWPELAGANLVFRVGQRYLHDIEAFTNAWRRRQAGGKPAEVEASSGADLKKQNLKKQDGAPREEGICLVTGEKALISRLHPPVKGLNATGAALSSFNRESFLSYGKEQNFNAPVSQTAAFGYTTALNYLIRHPTQSLRLGESTTVVCWAEKPTPIEDSFWSFWGGRVTEKAGATEVDLVSPDSRTEILRRLGQGLPVTEAWPELEPEVRLYVLALALNRTRLAVSFFLFGPSRDFLEHIQEYYRNLAIRHSPDQEPKFPSVWQIAGAVLGRHKEMKDIKRLGEDLLEAGLSGRSYPAYLLPMALQRLRSGDDFSSVLAGLIKAMLIRNFKQEVSMSLNPEHPSPAYQLGRLFALLAGVQWKAIKKNINADDGTSEGDGDGVQRRTTKKNINAGIRDKYYGSASATPALVFPLLLRNAQNHIGKIKNQTSEVLANWYDNRIREVLGHIDGGFPAHLNLKDQGYFALGYYHQRADRAVRQDEDVNPDQE